LARSASTVRRLLHLIQQGRFRPQIWLQGGSEGVEEHVLRNKLSNDNVKKANVLNASQVMNAVYNAELLFSVLGFQNKSLVEKKGAHGCKGV